MDNFFDQPEDINEILKIKRDKLTKMKQNGKDPFLQVKYEVKNCTQDILQNFEDYENKMVSIAGRIMNLRNMGKASFINISDKEGNIQVYIKKDIVGQNLYEDFIEDFDVGDIVGTQGIVFRTQKGEISIKAQQIVLLSKSLQVMPEKWHGLRDQEIRYRQRYVDLIVNKDVKDVFIKRSKIIKSIRNFLDNLDYLEVETPVLQTIAGGASARPFITHHNALDLQMYMRIALELPLKRLIVGGLEKVYEIGRVFRNEGLSIKHNPEFTMLELYEAYTDYHGMMHLIENLMRTVCKEVIGTYIIKYDKYEIDFSKPFKKITMLDAVKEYAKVDFSKIENLDQARKIAKEHQIIFEDTHLRGDILNLFFEKYVENNLIEPTFLMDHPVEISPLTKRKPDNSDYTERFELFIVGREFANAYSELNDPIDQKERFLYQEKLRSSGNMEANMIDDDFINALMYAMPPTGGLGLGIDRFVMLLTNCISIKDVLLFPTMKPI